jgi:small redox-active disulfide protein 2
MKIYVLGPGCQRCVSTEHNVKKALEELQIDAEVEKISDPLEFRRWRVMFTPALVIDDQLKASGRIPTTEEIKNWLKEKVAVG